MSLFEIKQKEVNKCPNCGNNIEPIESPTYPTPHYYCKNCNQSFEIWARGEGNIWEAYEKRRVLDGERK